MWTEDKLEVSIKSLPWAQKIPMKRRQNVCQIPSGWTTPGEQGPLSQLSKASLRTQRLLQQAQGLCGSVSVLLHIYYIYLLRFFYYFLEIHPYTTVVREFRVERCKERDRMVCRLEREVNPERWMWWERDWDGWSTGHPSPGRCLGLDYDQGPGRDGVGVDNKI